MIASCCSSYRGSAALSCNSTSQHAFGVLLRAARINQALRQRAESREAGRHARGHATPSILGALGDQPIHGRNAGTILPASGATRLPTRRAYDMQWHFRAPHRRESCRNGLPAQTDGRTNSARDPVGQRTHVGQTNRRIRLNGGRHQLNAGDGRRRLKGCFHPKLIWQGRKKAFAGIHWRGDDRCSTAYRLKQRNPAGSDTWCARQQRKRRGGDRHAAPQGAVAHGPAAQTPAPSGGTLALQRTGIGVIIAAVHCSSSGARKDA